MSDTLITRASTLTCPNCGHETEEEMPLNVCQFFYACSACKETFKPKQGDCCVYCSYGSSICPPEQAEKLGLDYQKIMSDL